MFNLQLKKLGLGESRFFRRELKKQFPLALYFSLLKEEAENKEEWGLLCAF